MDLTNSEIVQQLLNSKQLEILQAESKELEASNDSYKLKIKELKKEVQAGKQDSNSAGEWKVKVKDLEI